MKQRVDGQLGWVLHLHPYSETSLVVDVFTRMHGRVPLLARCPELFQFSGQRVELRYAPTSFSML